MELTKIEDRILRKALYSDLKERQKIYYALGFLLCVFYLLYLLDLHYGILGGIAVRVHGIFGLFSFLGVILILYIPHLYNERTSALALIRKLHTNLDSDKQLHANLNPDNNKQV